MTKTELARLACAVAVLRPDWPEASLRTFLTEHLAYRPYLDVAVALAWIATDPDTKTPARVLEAGPWWQAASTRDVPATRNDCPDHPEAALRVDPATGHTGCAACWANRHGTTTAAVFRRRPASPGDRAAIVAAFTTPSEATTGSET